MSETEAASWRKRGFTSLRVFTAEQRPSAPCGVLHFYFLVPLSGGRCLLSCGSFSPSLSLCRFDFENRECSSAGRSLPVVIEWLQAGGGAGDVGGGGLPSRVPC
ncbi:hypothetical protein PFLUV_G00197790 [Perca fluviatilis]|uniref:Uncharacterized protein n=1 Tax=Perca fluviatilis TaxID=8168 RepID=A0A6A5EE75_PERFL|nr:hypothetical protein PFLUV_G00197790 [Perca fluviatilis]